MVDQSSEGESELPPARPCIARPTSTGMMTRPMSKIMARSFGEVTDDLTMWLNTRLLELFFGGRHGLFGLLIKYDPPGGTRGAVSPGADDANDGWKDGKEDHNGNDVVNVPANVGDQMAKRVSTKDGRSNPADSSHNIEKQVARIHHFCGASDRRAERTNNRDEAGKNYGSAAISFIEVMGALEVAAAEKERVFSAIERGASRAANPVANLVPSNGAKHDRKQKPLEGNYASGREDARRDEKRITGKKKTDKEAGFDKNDGANERSAS